MNPRLLGPEPSALPTALHPDVFSFSEKDTLFSIPISGKKSSGSKEREWTKGTDYGIIKNMRRIKIEAGKQCPKCGKVENQVKMGYNRSGTQRCMCKECGTRYTIAPKIREYPEETRELAIKMYYSGVSGRGVGKLLGMSKRSVYNWIKKRTDC